MMKTKKRSVFLISLLLLSFSPAYSAQLTGEEIIRKSQEIFYYAGRDMKAEIQMKLINKNGKTRNRKMTMLRMNIGEVLGNQKFFMFFHQPADVRDTVFMVWKYPERDDDRWLFIPAIKLVRRIAASDQFSSFVGSDFTYEDISGRDFRADEHRLIETGDFDGEKVYVVESLPKLPASFTKKISWIDTETYLPLKEEYYDLQGEVFKIFMAERIETVNGIPTIVKRIMTNVKREHRTEVFFNKTEYNVGLNEGIFSERSLRNPPKRWIR